MCIRDSFNFQPQQLTQPRLAARHGPHSPSRTTTRALPPPIRVSQRCASALAASAALGAARARDVCEAREEEGVAGQVDHVHGHCSHKHGRHPAVRLPLSPQTPQHCQHPRTPARRCFRAALVAHGHLHARLGSVDWVAEELRRPA
eukprot:3315083-Rhodomonas_salina.1